MYTRRQPGFYWFRSMDCEEHVRPVDLAPAYRQCEELKLMGPLHSYALKTTLTSVLGCSSFPTRRARPPRLKSCVIRIAQKSVTTNRRTKDDPLTMWHTCWHTNSQLVDFGILNWPSSAV